MQLLCVADQNPSVKSIFNPCKYLAGRVSLPALTPAMLIQVLMHQSGDIELFFYIHF
jgi:hypothetical protein